MVTLAEILDMKIGTNLCKVRVPLFEPAGNKAKVEMWATMMLPPGIQAGYEVGDVVFVTFSDNDLGRPVVLGQLYRGPESSSNRIDNLGKAGDQLDRASKFSCLDLTAEGKVVLPASTSFTGTNPATGYNSIQDIIDAIEALKEKVAALEPQEDKGLLDMIFGD